MARKLVENYLLFLATTSPPCLRWSSLASQAGSELGTAQPQLVIRVVGVQKIAILQIVIILLHY